MFLKLAKCISKEFVYGGHLLSLGGTGIVWSVIILKELPFSWIILLISYLVPQIIYTYNHFKESQGDFLTNPERAKHLQKSIKYFPFIIIFHLSILLAAIFLFTNKNLFLFVMILIIGGFLYTIYFKKITARIICFKNLYVSLSWALIIFIPLFYYSIPFDKFFIIFFLFVFLRWIINTVFFDIKDIEDDKIKKLKTLPVILGKKNSLKYLKIVNIISFIPILIGLAIKEIPFFSIILLVFYFYSLYYIKKGDKKSLEEIRRISYIIVDGEYLIWPIILIIGRILI